MRNLASRSILLATAFALAGCGGGGDIASIGSMPPPAPTPTPPTPTPPTLTPPTPTPTYAPAIILPNVTNSTQFATLGYEGLFVGATTGSLIGSGFSVSYDATANNYVVDVPASEPGVYVIPRPGDVVGKLTDLSNRGQLQPITFGASRSIFDYTAWAFYQKLDLTAGWLTLGLATPQSGVPLTGSATYLAEAHGYGGGYIDGSATLKFDFGASTLSGNLALWDAEYDPGVAPRGYFDFVNTVVGTGTTLGQFSGELAGDKQRGSFNGLLTGPNAEELMARWTASYPNSNQIMYGIWVGKKN